MNSVISYIVEKRKNILLFLLFLILHLILLNINTAEWGDSYRILRASEYIRDFAYPMDEKRPPLFSLLLALRPGFVDQILWGRLFMFAVSILSFAVFYRLANLYIKEEKYRILALIIFVFNPVYLYWSLRIYADVPFTFLVITAFLLLKKWEGNLNYWKIAALGILAGLSVLTRFEGYILFIALAVGIVFSNGIPRFKTDIRKRIVSGVYYLAGFLITVLPYWLYRSPLNSSYLEEPSDRAYDFKMLVVYFMSLIFLFGLTSAWYFLIKERKVITGILRGELGLSLFIMLELLLVLLWPAAVPRLFIPVIPFLVIFLSLAIGSYFSEGQRSVITPLLGLTTLFVIYAVSQYILKLQFLILLKPVFLAELLIQTFSILFIITKKYEHFVVSSAFGMALWAISTVWLHKDNFLAIKSAAEYASQNLSGTIGHNDLSSVTDWYLNNKDHSDSVSGVFYPYSKKADLEQGKLKEKGFDYLILTNEHNTDMRLDIAQRPYLEEMKEFRYLVNGKVFFAKIIRVI